MDFHILKWLYTLWTVFSKQHKHTITKEVYLWVCLHLTGNAKILRTQKTLIGSIPICGKCYRNPTALLFCDINPFPCQIATKGINWISKLLCFDFRKVEYFNAKGSLVDKNTVKALDRHQNEVSFVICLYVWIGFHSLRVSGWPRNPPFRIDLFSLMHCKMFWDQGSGFNVRVV